VKKKAGSEAKGFMAGVSRRFPGLVAEIQKAVEDSERKFAGNVPEADGSFLWEHSVHVASLAYTLARAERTDAELAAVVALLHDAGKFAEGRYHEGDRPEEDEAARLAAVLLRRPGVKAAEREAAVKALAALYDPAAPRNPLAAVVHDADFLSKFGVVGVAQFFIKSALRGKTLRRAVAESLSKELTYAACLPLNMRTTAGRAFAGRKADATTAFFKAFLEEIRETQGMAFKVVISRFDHPRRPGTPFEVRLVVPEVCPSCGGTWRASLAAAAGKKCERLEARVECRGCGSSTEISFCLPELGP